MGSAEHNPEVSSCDAELAIQRDIIDEIDEQMVRLINKRAAAALEIGRIKAKNNTPIYQNSRETEVLERVCSTNKSDIVPDEDMKTLFRGIMRTSRAAQQRQLDEG